MPRRSNRHVNMRRQNREGLTMGSTKLKSSNASGIRCQGLVLVYKPLAERTSSYSVHYNRHNQFLP
jgi:hypothetical protein